MHSRESSGTGVGIRVGIKWFPLAAGLKGLCLLAFPELEGGRGVDQLEGRANADGCFGW